MLNDGDKSRVTQVAREQLGSEVTEIERIAGGSSTENYIVETADDKVLVRFYPSRISDAGYEFRVLKILHAADLPVPKQLHFEPTRENSRPFTMMEYIPGPTMGQELLSGKKGETLLRRYVEELHKIHQVNWRKLYGTVNLPDYKSEPDAYALRVVRSRIEEAKHLRLQEETKDVIDWMVNHATVPITEVQLLHGDYHPLNIIMGENGEMAIIDWEGVDLGDFRKDLAFAALAMGIVGDKAVEVQVISRYQQIIGHDVDRDALNYFTVTEAFHRVIKFYRILEQSSDPDPLFVGLWTYLRKRIQDITGIRLFPSLNL